MKYVNFPHQLNEIKKLEKTLAIAHQIITSGKNLDDSTFGYELFKEKLISTRKGYTETKLKKMPKNRQSPVMTARELKRTFRLLGFIEKIGDADNYALTGRGLEVIQYASIGNVDAVEKLIWRKSLLNLKFYAASDNVDTNKNFRVRPMYVMMNLLSVPMERKLLVFAMAAEDESFATLTRLKSIVKKIQLGDLSFDDEIKKLGMSTSNAKNNVKILPTLGIATDLFGGKDRLIRLAEDGRLFLDYEQNRIPIWYMDLDGDEQRRKCKSGILLALSKADIKKDTLDRVVVSLGLDTKIITEFGDNLVELKNNMYSLTRQISFDLYQDLPARARNSKTIEKFHPFIEDYTKSPKTKHSKYASSMTTKSHSVSISYKNSLPTSRKITNKDQLTRTYTYPSINIETELQRKKLLQEKDSKHQETVKKMFEKYIIHGWNDLSEWPYDLLARKNDVSVLHEIKTITKYNELTQVRKALGQLYYYEYFYFQNQEKNLYKSIVFDRPPNNARHIDFLRSYDILVFWFDNDMFDGEEDSLRQLDEILD